MLTKIIKIYLFVFCSSVLASQLERLVLKDSREAVRFVENLDQEGLRGKPSLFITVDTGIYAKNLGCVARFLTQITCGADSPEDGKTVSMALNNASTVHRAQFVFTRAIDDCYLKKGGSATPLIHSYFYHNCDQLNPLPLPLQLDTRSTEGLALRSFFGSEGGKDLGSSVEVGNKGPFEEQKAAYIYTKGLLLLNGDGTKSEDAQRVASSALILLGLLKEKSRLRKVVFLGDAIFLNDVGVAFQQLIQGSWPLSALQVVLAGLACDREVTPSESPSPPEFNKPAVSIFAHTISAPVPVRTPPGSPERAGTTKSDIFSSHGVFQRVIVESRAKRTSTCNLGLGGFSGLSLSAEKPSH